MSQDKAGPPAPGTATIKAIAADFHGVTLDDAGAARIAAGLAKLMAGFGALGTAPLDAPPGALFRRVLLNSDAIAARRA